MEVNCNREDFALDNVADVEYGQIGDRLIDVETRIERYRQSSTDPSISIADRAQSEEEDGVLIDISDDDNLTQQRPEDQASSDLSELCELMRRYVWNNIVLEPGCTVEIRPLVQRRFFKASFLRIKHIVRRTNGIYLGGIALTRLKHLAGILPRHRNEVALILHVHNSCDSDDEIQGAIEVPVTDVIKIRNCHFTNADYPLHRANTGVYRTTTETDQQGVLMCRWRYIFRYKDAATRTKQIHQEENKYNFTERVVEHVNAKHLTRRRFQVPEVNRFNLWRGGKTRGGEYDPSNGSGRIAPVIPLDSEEESELIFIAKSIGQRYTFGDMFCGAGGASCGADKAGFHIKISCDHNKDACETFRAAFPKADLYEQDVFEFIRRDDVNMRVDVLHLSPPCQFWSPAHTTVGVNDDRNIAALSSCRELIKKLRPRLVTLEQTFGILHQNFEAYFNALVCGFSMNNYSVRWKIVDFRDWGLPAARQRLIMIGSCAGEDLPPFPTSTHAEVGTNQEEKKPWNTVKKMLLKIPHYAESYDSMHQPVYVPGVYYSEGWDANQTLRRCITTNGGYGNHHPDGRRNFTLREYATLQTFPVEWPFGKIDRKRQIGNAFPPLVAKALYTHLRKWLEKQDRVYTIENELIDEDDPDIEIYDLDAYPNPTSGPNGYPAGVWPSPPTNSSYQGTIYPDSMDLTIDMVGFPLVPCIDANQRPRRRRQPPIVLSDSQRSSETGDIDLTMD
ncbi:S-adenosyl-L-methionine-dependent methyltransferase [Astrocystis sublimbata]|nr:S-adenosyl-L-methionine-dependent methyltransferase [Astrocystis sublimbata]